MQDDTGACKAPSLFAGTQLCNLSWLATYFCDSGEVKTAPGVIFLLPGQVDRPAGSPQKSEGGGESPAEISTFLFLHRDKFSVWAVAVGQPRISHARQIRGPFLTTSS